MNELRVMLEEDAFMPEQAYVDWDAGFDLKTPIDFLIPAGEKRVIDTGVHFEIPQGWYGKIESKSGLNANSGVVSCGGIIDAGYTGSVTVVLYNLSDKYKYFKRGNKIAQIIFMQCASPKLVMAESFNDTPRGDSKFGSTGV